MGVRFPPPALLLAVCAASGLVFGGCREYVGPPAASLPGEPNEPAVSEPPVEIPSEGFVWPVQGKVVSSFGAREAAGTNKGIDISVAAGAEVVASRGGTVSFIHSELPGYGKTIIIDHNDGFATVYARLGEIFVQPGQRVMKGQRIAGAGQDAHSGGSTIHYEIRRKQKPQNPFYYLP